LNNFPQLQQFLATNGWRSKTRVEKRLDTPLRQ
jgi:hypothetical protein